MYVATDLHLCNAVQVVRAGVIDPALNSDSSHAQSTDTQSANGHAVCDALECLGHILAASKEGHAVALQSGGLSAAAQVLKVSSHLGFDLFIELCRCH